MKKFFRYTMLAALSVGAMNANAAPIFDIVVDYKSTGEVVEGGNIAQSFSSRQLQLFGAAEMFWESVLVGFQGITNPTYNLQAWLTPEDGTDGSLAFAGPREFEDTASGFNRATAGIMQFDADDFGPNATSPQSEQLFLDSAVHEIAHALGFGTQFEANNLTNSANDEYIGANALAVFNDDYGTSETFISLQIGGGHWNECWVERLFGACSPEDGGPDPTLFNDTELMTPFAVDVPATFSATTIAAFQDLGYLTIDPFTQGISIPLAANIPFNVPTPAMGSLILASMFGLYTAGRRRRS